jgi:hypothetical protein
MTARDIIRAEYGCSRNLMTPDILEIGRTGEKGTRLTGAYEISEGAGIENGTMLVGVSVVRLNPDGTTTRDTDRSRVITAPGPYGPPEHAAAVRAARLYAGALT